VTIAAVTGRFQPVHAQHLELFALALAEHDHLVVAVTNPDTDARHLAATSAHRHTDDANPFTYFERARLLAAALQGAGMADRATVVPFDLTRPAVWPDYVPLSAVQYVRAFSAWESDKAGRLADGGYGVVLVDGDPATKLDAATIRAGFADDSWVDRVPQATVPVLRELLRERVPR
jgi:cytidyltransferase-like protein